MIHDPSQYPEQVSNWQAATSEDKYLDLNAKDRFHYHCHDCISTSQQMDQGGGYDIAFDLTLNHNTYPPTLASTYLWKVADNKT